MSIEVNRLFIVESEIKMIFIQLSHDGGHGRKYRDVSTAIC